MSVSVRVYQPADWPQLWSIIHEIVRAAETFTYDPRMSEKQAQAMWIEQPPAVTVVAVEDDRIVGSAKMGANRPGPGSHVATASFMVASNARGRGVGRTLCAFAIDWARRQDFAAMQFNAVVDANHAAVALYRQLGFEIIGTVPRSFDHPTLGRIGLHVMYLEFE